MAKLGQPLIFKSKKELEEKIQAYFDSCKPHIDERPTVVGMFKTTRGKKKVEFIRPCKRGEAPNHWIEGKEKYITNEEPVTITGLAVALGTNRQTLINYSKREEYFDTITRAKDYIHAFAEKSLWEPKITSGIIFNLKNNWDWKDQSEVKHTEIPTGYEDLTDEELNQKLEQLRRKNPGGLLADGNGKPEAKKSS